MKIKYVDWGVANNFGDRIEINRNLKNYPKLLAPILSHEQAHTDKTISWEDIKLDFFSNSNINSWEMFKFMIKHPKSFTQLLPFYVTKKGITCDINLIIMYSISITIFITTIYFGGKYL